MVFSARSSFFSNSWIRSRRASFLCRRPFSSIPNLPEDRQTFFSGAISCSSPCLTGLPWSRAKRRSNPFIPPLLLFHSNNTARREFNATVFSITGIRGCKAKSIPSIARSCHWFSKLHATPNSRHTSPGFRLSVHTESTARHFSSAVWPDPFRPFLSSIPGLSTFGFSVFSIGLLPLSRFNRAIPLFFCGGDLIDPLLLSAAFLILHHQA